MTKYKRFEQRFNPWYSILKSPYLINNLKCASPIHLREMHLHQLKEDQLQCNHSCTESNSTVRINCNEKRIKKLPFLKHISSKVEIYFGFNSPHEFPIINITVSILVILLDLSYNYIATIPITFSSQYPNIRHLNLAGNHLTAIPSADEWKIINSLQVLELKTNSFTCNCSGLKLKQNLISISLQTRVRLKDLNQITCSFPSWLKDKMVYDLPDTFFGCPTLNLVLILTLTLSLLLLFCVATFIAYVFRYYINLFLFIHFGWRFCYSYTKDETLYDTFISYSFKDSGWVIDQLMKPLENLNPPYNLCLHERDFLVGVPICDNITN